MKAYFAPFDSFIKRGIPDRRIWWKIESRCDILILLKDLNTNRFKSTKRDASSGVSLFILPALRLRPGSLASDLLAVPFEAYGIQRSRFSQAVPQATIVEHLLQTWLCGSLCLLFLPFFTSFRMVQQQQCYFYILYDNTKSTRCQYVYGNIFIQIPHMCIFMFVLFSRLPYAILFLKDGDVMEYNIVNKHLNLLKKEYNLIREDVLVIFSKC